MQLYETYHNSQRSYLVLELAGRSDLLGSINVASGHHGCPGLEEMEAHGLSQLGDRAPVRCSPACPPICKEGPT